MGYELEQEVHHENQDIEAKSARLNAIMRIAAEMKQAGIEIPGKSDKNPRTDIQQLEHLMNNGSLDPS